MLKKNVKEAERRTIFPRFDRDDGGGEGGGGGGVLRFEKVCEVEGLDFRPDGDHLGGAGVFGAMRRPTEALGGSLGFTIACGRGLGGMLAGDAAIERMR